MNQKKPDDSDLPPAPGPDSWSAAEAADWDPQDDETGSDDGTPE